MMKKPPGLWLLLSAGVLWLCFQDVSCVRATSLIFGKSTTTTTTTPDPTNESSSSSSASSPTNENSGDTSTNSTNSADPSKPILTGVPQVDYQWDPNLPRELNGYNLTEYPFYDGLPDDIDFKCDGLHDGFYASVPHKCQVYHHCLFGTRYDFLCANFTAFDQKTFICHFVSEVDCVNSKKFWHRNDALYQAASTTTVKPVIVYTPPPPPAILTGGGGASRRPQNVGPASRRRKPARRRRPQYDYYDEYDEEDEEYYEEPRYTATESPRSEGRRRNKRPRPRPRPIYDDEYEEYEDDRYERRRGSSRRGDDDRRYKNRPTSRRNKEDRRKYEEQDEEYEEEDPRFDRSEERRIKNKPKESERKRPVTDEDKRPEERKREEKRPSEERRFDKRRQEDDDEEERRPRPRKGTRRPVVDDDYEDENRRPIKKKEETPTGPGEDNNNKPLAKPSGSSLYDRPRVAPRIRPPVPKSEADKYAYKTTPSPAKSMDEEEYYEDYEEEAPKKRLSAKDSQADASIHSNSRKTSTPGSSQAKNRDRDTRRSRPKQSRRPVDEEYYEDEEERPSRRVTKPKNDDRRVGLGSRKRPASIEYEDEYEEIEQGRGKDSKDKEREQERKSTTPSTTTTTARRKFSGIKDSMRSKPSTITTTTSTTTTTTTTEAPQKEENHGSNNYKSVRIVKRPFLPSRGGNPYVARGLQPIGLKTESQKTQESRQQSQVEEIKEFDEEVLKPLKTMKNKPQQDVILEDYRPVSRPGFINRQNMKTTATDSQSNYQTTQAQTAKPIEKNPLDLDENEYDVTLNDALNPTLPNLPLRQFPSGFSNNVNNEYTFSPFHRPRYVVDATINQASSEYQYRFKQPQALQLTQAQSQSNLRLESKQSNGHAPQHGHHQQQQQQQARQPESHQDFIAQYSNNYQQFRPSPHVAHTQAFYATY